MSKREDEYYRRNYYGGHPPACTCVECTERRLEKLDKGHSLDKLWLIALVITCLVAITILAWLLLTSTIKLAAGIFAAAISLLICMWALFFT